MEAEWFVFHFLAILKGMFSTFVLHVNNVIQLLVWNFWSTWRCSPDLNLFLMNFQLFDIRPMIATFFPLSFPNTVCQLFGFFCAFRCRPNEHNPSWLLLSSMLRRRAWWKGLNLWKLFSCFVYLSLDIALASTFALTFALVFTLALSLTLTLSRYHSKRLKCPVLPFDGYLRDTNDARMLMGALCGRIHLEIMSCRYSFHYKNDFRAKELKKWKKK